MDVQWYDLDDRYHRFVVLWPAMPGSPVVVLHQHLFSPGLGWFAPTMSDFDHDGRPDLAFVARGVGTCGGEAAPDCPVWRADVLMTGTDTPDTPLPLVSVQNEEALTKAIGLEDLGGPGRWQGRPRPGAVDFTLSSLKSRHLWTVALRDGALRLLNPLH